MTSNSFKPVDEQLAYLKKGIAEIIPEAELKASLEKSRQTGVFLIGDFSAMIGDPTGVSETRPPLTREQVDANAQTYLAQVFKILDKDKTEVRRNSDWLSKQSAEDIVRLCSHYRLARMLEREDFRSRLDEGQPISVHEVLYPLLTAFDAVSLKRS